MNREMGRRLACLAIAVLLQVATNAHAQKVLIRNATPAAVLEALKTNLLPQEFKLVDSNNKGALFTLDRGNVVQQSGPIASVHVVIELQFRYKAKPDGLEVSASQEAVGATGSRSTDYRKPMDSQGDRTNLQHFLDSIRVQVEAQPPLGDSAAKRN